MISGRYVHILFCLYCYQETEEPQISHNMVSPEDAKETDDTGYPRWSGQSWAGRDPGLGSETISAAAALYKADVSSANQPLSGLARSGVSFNFWV